MYESLTKDVVAAITVFGLSVYAIVIVIKIIIDDIRSPRTKYDNNGAQPWM